MHNSTAVHYVVRMRDQSFSRQKLTLFADWVNLKQSCRLAVLYPDLNCIMIAQQTVLTLYQPITHICVMSTHKNLYGGLILGVNTLYRLFCLIPIYQVSLYSGTRRPPASVGAPPPTLSSINAYSFQGLVVTIRMYVCV